MDLYGDSFSILRQGQWSEKQNISEEFMRDQFCSDSEN